MTDEKIQLFDNPSMRNHIYWQVNSDMVVKKHPHFLFFNPSAQQPKFHLIYTPLYDYEIYTP